VLTQGLRELAGIFISSVSILRAATEVTNILVNGVFDVTETKEVEDVVRLDAEGKI
jgi:hypothetical protein